jgi:CubicO group peptidase (beta-lactamase class C family)
VPVWQRAAAGTRSGMPQTGNEVAPGYEPVAEEFERNFTERGEVGAAFAAFKDGELVVELYGGVADPADGRPWERDTLCGVFSGTKGLLAACLLGLIERGALDLDAPVAAYWPEFAAGGKGDVLVRHAVSHTAGVPGIRSREPAADELLDERRMAAAVAAEVPFWPPGEVACYHALTYGWIAAELIVRIDGRPAGRYFAEEIAEPLGLEAWIGLPAELEPRVAPFVRAPGFGAGAEPVPPELAELDRAVWRNPPIVDGALDWNSRAVHAAGIPGGGAIANARSMARFYSWLATGGEGLLAPETIALGSRRLSYSLDPLSGKPTTHGVGF